jgi:hypothetical protein
MDSADSFRGERACYATSAPLADGQCTFFVQNRELFAKEPFNITTDEPFVDELTELITRLATGGLQHASEAA